MAGLIAFGIVALACISLMVWWAFTDADADAE